MKKLSLRVLSFTIILALCIGCSSLAFASAPESKAELPDLFAATAPEASDPIPFELPDLTGVDFSRKHLTKEQADARLAAVEADSAAASFAAPAFVSTSDELVAAIADPDASIIFIMNDIEFDQTLQINRSINFVSMGGTVTLSLALSLTITQAIEVTGGNITLSFENVILQGKYISHGIVHNAEHLTLRGLVIQKFFFAIISTIESGDLLVYDCNISNNYTGDPGGAGIMLVASDLIVYNSIISDNINTFAGGQTGGTGIYVVVGSAYIYQSEINNNLSERAGNYGSLTVALGNLYLTDSEVSGNDATHGGGITVIQQYYESEPEIPEYPAWGHRGEVVIKNSKINDNVGGGILLLNCNALIESSEINRNTSDEGAGIRVFASDLTLRNIKIEENTAEHNGGGISISNSGFDGFDPINTSTVTLESGSISGNQSGGWGGGVYMETEKTSDKAVAFLMESGKMEENAAPFGGGAICALQNAKITIHGGSISYNYLNYDELPGNPPSGGAILTGDDRYNGGHLSELNIHGGDFIGNRAYIGGAIVSVGALIANAVFQENEALGGNAIGGYNLTISNCEFSDHNNGNYGILYLFDQTGNYESTVIKDSEIHHNSSTDYGTIVSIGAKVELENTNIYENSAANGAAVSLIGQSEFIMNSGTIRNNYASNRGGAVYAEDSTFTIAGGSILSNEAGVAGGGICSNATVNIRGGVIDDNYSVNGGGIYMESTGTLNLLGGELTYNTALNGGGIYSLGRLTISGGTISDNIASTSGGGVYSAGQAAMTAGEISYNTARNGGGIYTTSSFSFVGTGSIIYNSATAYGGGIYGSSSSIVLLYLVTLENNTARTDGNDIYSLGVVG